MKWELNVLNNPGGMNGSKFESNSFLIEGDEEEYHCELLGRESQARRRHCYFHFI